MRTALLVSLSALAGLVAAAACGGDDSTSGTPEQDAAPEGASADDGATVPDRAPPPDAAKAACTLGTGDDPVMLCAQKLVLGAIHASALVLPTGVAASWDRATGAPDRDGAGGTLHDLRDDAAYAAACTNYAQSASRYGDTELSSTLLADFTALVPILKTELSPLPDEYSGELYLHLRDVAVGLRYVSDNDGATALDAVADQVGANVYAHFLSLSSADGGADAGPDAGDAGFTLAGDGVLVADSTNKDYAPGDVASGAAALVDMAVRHPADPNAAGWALAAVESFEHLYLRAREAKTGAYYRLLVPSATPGHDDLSPRAPAPADLLATGTTASVALALLRAADRVASGGGAGVAAIAGYPFASRANDALAAMHGTPSFYDAAGGGYFEGVIATTGALLTNKPTRANATMLAALHRATVLRVTPFTKQALAMRATLGATTPVGKSLLAALSGQSAYFELVSKDFAVPPGDLDGSFDPHPTSYVSGASLAAVDAMNEQWIGYP